MPRTSTSFQKGQSGNPTGRPSPIREELRGLLDKEFTQVKRRQVLRGLITDAIEGDKDARQLLLAYTYGKPTEYKEINGTLTNFLVDIDTDDSTTDDNAPEDGT